MPLDSKDSTTAQNTAEPPKELTPDELFLTYGLEPTTIENLKATQPNWEKLLGMKVSLEEVYFLEFDQPDRGEVEDEM